jgi:hypothetical protein
MAASRPKSAPVDRIESAQAALAEANRLIAELTEQRNGALLRDDTGAAIELGAKVAQLKLAARAHEDKITLLREQAAEEERARKAKEREAQIERISAQIDERDKALQEVATAIKQLATASERAIELNREVVSAWTWLPHDLPPALLTPSAIMSSIGHEFFRTSYHPRRYGGMDLDPLAGLSLPGSRSPRFEWAEHPERVRPLVDVVRDASAFAKEFLRTGKGSAGVVAPHGEPVQRTDAEVRLGSLLKRQAELAEDMSPQGEISYRAVVEQIAQVQAEITATKQMEAQHAR